MFKKGKSGRSESIQKRIFRHLIPIMIGSICAIILASSVVLLISGYKDEKQILANNVSMATRQISLMLEQIRDNSRAFSTTSQLQQAMAHKYDQNSNARRNFSNDIRSSIYSFVNIEPYAWEMTLVSVNGMTYLYPSGAVVPSSMYTDLDWYKNAVARNGRVSMATEREDLPDGAASNLILEKSILDTETGVLLGALRIKVRENLFSDTFPAIQQLVGGDYYILDGGGTIIASQNKDELFSRLEGADQLYGGGPQQDAIVSRLGGRLMIAAARRTDVLNWYVIGIVPFSGIFTRNWVLIVTMLIVGLVFLGLSVISIIGLSRRLVKPILYLVAATKNVGQGDLSTEIPVTSTDEIGQLTQSFNGMLKDIRTLTHQIWLEQHVKREYALQFMQTQINPHLLYNSVMSINHLITSDRRDEASSALTHLGQYYKKVLDKNNASATVADDIELSLDYMILQQQIHSGLFEYRLDLPKELLGFPFMKLTLQPIIENSILHGFKGYLTTGGLIAITGRVDGDMIEICVEDNGRGMSPEALEQFRNGTGAGQHYGLRNISERIKLRFGPRAGLRVDGRPGGGTRVTLRVPAAQNR